MRGLAAEGIGESLFRIDVLEPTMPAFVDRASVECLIADARQDCDKSRLSTSGDTSALKRYFEDLVNDGGVLLAPATDGLARSQQEGTGSPKVQGLIRWWASLFSLFRRGAPIASPLACNFRRCEGRLFAAAGWIETGLSRLNRR
jgi:hypothetical protein